MSSVHTFLGDRAAVDGNNDIAEHWYTAGRASKWL